MGKRILVAAACIIALELIVWFVSGGARKPEDSGPTQRQAKIALEDCIRSGKPIPVERFVSLEIRRAIGSFAVETAYGADGSETVVAEYYYVKLEDGSIIALRTENAQEIEALEKINFYTVSYGRVLDNETLRVQGLLTRITDDTLVDLYRNNLERVTRHSSGDVLARFLCLDTALDHEESKTDFWMIWIVSEMLVVILIMHSRWIKL